MKSIYIALITGVSLFSTAQNTIVGTVSDKDNKALSNVIVSIPEIHKETITDVNGKYTIANLPNGTFKISFSSVGYTTKILDVLISEKDPSYSELAKQFTQNIILEENIIHMDEVIVSTAFNKLQSQNVMKVEHANLKSLQQKGTATLIEGLATIPGVSQVSTGTSIGKPVIRGLSGNRVLVYS
ncbi:MAG: TonB-dependent receptor, partial [Flavobacteriaceae bacterium]|nr:TonB-dependent receptor [Flavobacteriaceae bacterium]